MTATPPQMVQLACPVCRTPIQTQIVTLIDAGQQPELKNALLAGQLNVVVCPNCGNTAMIAAPLIYHDAAKQLFLVHFPQQMNARPEEQERFIGEATSLLMRSLPPDASRGYLLSPRRFLTLNTLVETILEADGISREMIAAQRQRVELISQFAEVFEQGDEQQLAALVEQHREQLNEEFFGTLLAFAGASAQGGRGEMAQLLQQLYQKLVELTGFEPEGSEPDLETEQVIERLVNASAEELEQTVAELRPLIDYSFFEALTARIDAAQQQGDAAEAQRLTDLRTKILDLVEAMDRQAQQLFESGATMLREILEADNMEEALRARRESIDEAFLLVLDANRAAAERAGNAEIVARLEEIRRRATAILEESLSPEDRLINQMVQAESHQEAQKLLRSNPALVNTAFVKRLNELADQLEQQGRKPQGERLRQLAREASAMLF